MEQRKQYWYVAGGRCQARVSRFSESDGSKHYIRYERWCDQAQELVTVAFRMGTAEQCRTMWIDWQAEAFVEAEKAGRVHLVKVDGTPDPATIEFYERMYNVKG